MSEDMTQETKDREMKNPKVKNQRRYNKKIQHMSNICLTYAV